MAGKDEEELRPREDSLNIGRDPRKDDFNLFRNRRVLFPTAFGILFIVIILLLPLVI